MADNLGYTPGSGAEVATDEIGGKHHQRIKLVLGADGVSDGDVSSDNPMPVRDSGLVLLFQRMLAYLQSPLGYDKSLQRQRGTVVVESGTVTTVTTVTTCSTVTNLSTVDTLQGRLLINGANLSAWSDCVRSRIT